MEHILRSYDHAQALSSESLPKQVFTWVPSEGKRMEDQETFCINEFWKEWKKDICMILNEVIQ